jgi:nucleotide-binding universal stress UspA family protein
MTPIRTILFPTDLSEPSARAFEHARFLSERFGARLTLYHALVVDAVLARAGLDEAKVVDAAYEEARAHLDTLARRLATPPEVVIQKGLAVPAFADAAVLARIADMRPDLTVMATHSREGVGSYFVGTVTERVVRESHAPVLVVRKGAREDALPYRRILVATDFSPASQRAFPWSRLLAREMGAELIALHVAAKAAEPAQATSVLEELRRFVAPGHEGVEVRPVLAHGTAWKEIVSLAAREDVDLIVMATKGHDSLGDDLLGSHADRVIRHAPCAVWTVG